MGETRHDTNESFTVGYELFGTGTNWSPRAHRLGGVLTMASADGRSVAYGGLVGIAAWVLGYVFTYLIAAPDLRESGISRLLDAIQGEPAIYEMVGWVFYNTHFVGTVISGVPVFSSSSTTFVGGENGLTPLLYLLPVALLIAAGLAMARMRGAQDFGDGVVSGLLVVPGYLVLAIAGALLFGLQFGDATVAPDILSAIALAGVAYPAVCGGLGGALGALTAGS